MPRKAKKASSTGKSGKKLNAYQRHIKSYLKGRKFRSRSAVRKAMKEAAAAWKPGKARKSRSRSRSR
jgi:hypothetical protein